MKAVKLIATAVLSSLAALPAAAQTWPNKPLKIVVPFAPGGTSDFIARLINGPLGEALGQQVIVENKPGAAGNMGAALVAQATDQHTVMLSDLGSLAISPLVSKDLAYKLSDLKGVAMLGYSPHMLAVHPAVPAKNLAELVAHSKTKPLNVASSGSGSPNHLGIVEISQATGMRWQHIPYKGGGQALLDTIGGTTDVILNGMTATNPHVKSGKLKLIAISKSTRVSELPDTPTIAEQGVKGYESGTYQGVTAPATLPAEHIAKLNAALNKVMQLPDVAKRMAENGAEVTTASPAAVSDFITKEAARWDSVIKKAGQEIEGTK
jgi:tripartite-type tricarboxylate transporter receptor subunit TctC